MRLRGYMEGKGLHTGTLDVGGAAARRARPEQVRPPGGRGRWLDAAPGVPPGLAVAVRGDHARVPHCGSAPARGSAQPAAGPAGGARRPRCRCSLAVAVRRSQPRASTTGSAYALARSLSAQRRCSGAAGWTRARQRWGPRSPVLPSRAADGAWTWPLCWLLCISGCVFEADVPRSQHRGGYWRRAAIFCSINAAIAVRRLAFASAKGVSPACDFSSRLARRR